MPLLFIEVKSFQVSPTLDTQGSIIAQALREAHTLLCEDCLRSGATALELPFIVTNSKYWSFGLVKKSDIWFN